MRTVLSGLFGLALGVALGYYVGNKGASHESDVAAAKYHLHEAIGYASVCGNHLHYSSPEPSSQAAIYAVKLSTAYANEALDMMTKHTAFFFPITNQKEGLIRGRDYMLRNGFNEEAKKAEALLAAIAKNPVTESR